MEPSILMSGKHLPAMTTESTFAEKLTQAKASGEGLLTIELSPPRGTDMSGVGKRAAALKPWVDGINIPDCQRSLLKLSSMAAAVWIQQNVGLEAIWQLTCRDRNLIALQADLMGAHALGLRNVVALTGDPVQVGDHKDVAQQVFHLDSVRLLGVVSHLNNELDATGKDLKHQGTQLSKGSALNPARLNNHAQKRRLQRKLAQGVDFFQTQPVYSVDVALQALEAVQEAADAIGCPAPVVIMGIVPPKSAKMAQNLNHTVMGINVPESLIEAMEVSKDPVVESFNFCADLMAAIKPHNPHFHIMPVAVETRVPELLTQVFGKGKYVGTNQTLHTQPVTCHA